MRPSSRDLRSRIVQAYEHREGSRRQLAARCRVSLSCVRDLLTRYRVTGAVAPKPHGGGYPAKLDATSSEALTTLGHAPPEATLQELRTHLATAPQVTVSPATLSRALATLGRPRKQNVSGLRARAARRPAATGGVSRHRDTTHS